ncbi:MAG: DNA gyrase subunit A [Deltaproteobacteria bacterium]|jgi:DNA gyrase subunit A|nr:DNA gyrase subunit A [Deltaproteobacteria bacterium]
MSENNLELERIEIINIEEEIKSSYLDYAMSVIIGRALPDARDGLKPVHRRVLYAMGELGNDYNKPYKKSARVVGDVIGKYHPHGDAAVYDALVRLAQDFSMRYPLADGQGNFGSVDGDQPAAMRYTEVRLSKLAHEFMSDLDKKTVDFIPNYDGSLDEPQVMPTRVPGLLVNGSSGIAVGMATNIPPHNLGEILSGLTALIDNPGITIDELMRYIPGPDFPTAGAILGRKGIVEAYHTGKGIIKIRAKAEFENLQEGKQATGVTAIVVTELPYQVNKAKLVETIDDMVKSKKIDGIGEIRDESDRDGMRVVMELKRDKRDMAETVLNQLYHNTQMEASFGINMLAIVNQTPRLLNLKEALFYFLEHRKEVVTRRTRFELAKAEARAHILEGLRIALERLDEVIALIRRSRNAPEAKSGLVSTFSLSEIQAQAILDLRLQRLTQLERQAIDDEYANILVDIRRYQSILASEAVLLQVIKDEFVALKSEFGDKRRTLIADAVPEVYHKEDFISEEPMVVTITHAGYIKRTALTAYRQQKRGGKGLTGAKTKEADFVETVLVASTHSFLLFITSKGRLHKLKVHEIPLSARTSKGKAMVNVIPGLTAGEKVNAVFAVNDMAEKNRFVFMTTKAGIVKKVPLEGFQNVRKGGLMAITMKTEDDELVSAALTDGQGAVVLSTYAGKAICFKESDIRSMGRFAIGVRGIKLVRKDRVVSMDVISQDRTEVLMTVTEKGYGKRTKVEEYSVQRRGGLGILTTTTGGVVGVLKVTESDRLMLMTNTGRLILFKISEVRLSHRYTHGVKLMDLEPTEIIVDVALLPSSEDDDSPDEAENGYSYYGVRTSSQSRQGSSEENGSDSSEEFADDGPVDFPDDSDDSEDFPDDDSDDTEEFADDDLDDSDDSEEFADDDSEDDSDDSDDS